MSIDITIDFNADDDKAELDMVSIMASPEFRFIIKRFVEAHRENRYNIVVTDVCPVVN